MTRGSPAAVVEDSQLRLASTCNRLHQLLERLTPASADPSTSSRVSDFNRDSWQLQTDEVGLNAQLPSINSVEREHLHGLVSTELPAHLLPGPGG